MSSPLEIEERHEPEGVVHVLLHGELDVGSAERLEARLGELVKAARQVIIDLRGLTFMDSTGVRIVWEMASASANDGFDLALIQGPTAIRSVFEMSGLITRLPFVEP
jgi:anti-anti-sigma factor